MLRNCWNSFHLSINSFGTTKPTFLSFVRDQSLQIQPKIGDCDNVLSFVIKVSSLTKE